jgi:putative transposase
MMEKIGFDHDHVHPVMVIPPKYAIADVIGMLKNQSASLMRQKFEWLRKVFWRESIFGSPGYFVSSVGIHRDTILQYVEYQGRQDSGQLPMEL